MLGGLALAARLDPIGRPSADKCRISRLVSGNVDYAEADLPEDPRVDWACAHGPDGRVAYVREEAEPFTLAADGKNYALPEGFIVWEDGIYRAITREEFGDSRNGWDLDVGPTTIDVAEAEDSADDPRGEA